MSVPYEIPPLPPLTHAYREETVSSDNRGIDIVHRTTVFGVAPRGWPEWLARTVIELPFPDPLGRGMIPRPVPVSVAVDATVESGDTRCSPLLVALEKSGAALTARVHEVAAEHHKRLQEARGSRIIQARGQLPGMPGPR